MENVKRKRIKSLVFLVILLGLCVMAGVIWFFYYRNKTYISDAVAYVDGTIETEPKDLDAQVRKMSSADPAPVIRAQEKDETRIAIVFEGLTEEEDMNAEILRMLEENGIRASFALSASEGLENDEIVRHALEAGNELISNGTSGESGIHTKEEKEVLELMEKSREVLSTSADEAVSVFYSGGTRVTAGILQAAFVSGYGAVLDPDQSHVLGQDSFKEEKDAKDFVNALHGDVIVVMDLRGAAEQITDEDAVRVEKPAIDKQPDLDSSLKEKEEPVPVLTQVEWLLSAVENGKLKTDVISSFEKMPGYEALKEELESGEAERAVLYTSCLTDQDLAGVGIRELPASSEETDQILAALDELAMQATFFVDPFTAGEKNDVLEKLAAAGNSIGISIPSDDLSGLSASETFDRMYEGVNCARDLPGYTGLYLAEDGENLDIVRKCAKILNLRVILQNDGETLEPGTIRVMTGMSGEKLSELKGEADAAGIRLTDIGSLMDQSGVLSVMSPETLNGLRKENGHRMAEEKKQVYTTERAVGFAFYGMNNQAAAMDAADRLKARNGKGTFFVELGELTSCQEAVEHVLQAGDELGIYYRETSDYPQTFDAVMNYIHSWNTYAKWRYGVDTDLIFVTGNLTDEMREAASASGCSLVRNTFLVVKDEDKDLTLEEVPDALEKISGMRAMRGSFICFNMDFYENDRESHSGNTILGAVLDGFMDQHIDTLAYRSHETGEIEDASRFAVTTVSGILNSPAQYTFCEEKQTDITMDRHVLGDMETDEERMQFIADRYYGNVTVDTKSKLPGFTAQEIKMLDKKGTFTDDPVIFLTFDDWGTEESINELLYVLEKHHVKATFFVRTGYVDFNPNLLRTIAEQGHQIASHTDNHLVLADSVDGNDDKTVSLTEEEAEVLRKDLVVSYDKLYRYTGDVTTDGKPALTRMFRPPTLAVSRIGLSQVFDVGFEYSISGAYSTGDYEASSYEDMIDRLTRRSIGGGKYEKIQNGTVIVMHMQENAKYTAQALDTMIPVWEQQGYSFARIDDYLGR